MSKRCFLYSAAAIAVLAGCASPPPPPQTEDAALRTARSQTSFAIVRFMDEGTLKARYGARNNPFIGVSHAFTPGRFVVFKLNVEEIKQPLVLDLTQIVFSLGGKAASALPLQRIKDYWAFEDPNSGIRGVEVDIRDRTLREEMMPDRLTLPAGARVSRLLVFSENFPKQGDAELTIPLFDPQGRVVEKLKFTFTF